MGDPRVETDGKAKAKRVLQGGATAYPRAPDPRPVPTDTPKLAFDALVATVRGPALAVLFTKAAHPTYLAVVKALLSRGYSAPNAFSIMMSAIHIGLYTSMNGTFLVWDKLKWMQRYKLARRPAAEPSNELIRKTIVEFAVGQLLNGFVLYPMLYKAMKKCGAPDLLAPLPSAVKLYAYFASAYWFNNIGFTLAHRAVHSKMLYKRIHKKHHEFIGTMGIAAENAHPVEAVLANAFPTVGLSALGGAHPAAFLAWLAWRLEETFEAHSGFCFVGTWLHSIGLTHGSACAFHDAHHTANKGNFGGMPILDRIMGTDDAWQLAGGEEGYVGAGREQYEASKKTS